MFARYSGEISITILVKKINQNFSKNPKSPILRALWVLFAQIWANMNFPGKKGLC